MRRLQFSLKTLLWLMAVVAAFCAGAVWQRQKMIADGWFDLGSAVREALDRGTVLLPASQAPRSFLPKK